MEVPEVLPVVCAIIEHNDHILILQRSELMSHALLWEFPGGKIENNESEIDCITREILEELNLVIIPTERLSPVVHAYPKFTVKLIPYISILKEGVLCLSEHKSYKWVKPPELKNYVWCEADLPIVEEYLNKVGL